MLLSDSPVRPWRNPLRLRSRLRPPGDSLFIFSTVMLKLSPRAIFSLSTRLSTSSFFSIREVGRCAFADSVGYRSEFGVEGEDEIEEEGQDEEEWDEEESAEESEFVEIGYIMSVHGLQGEVRVKSSTAFPELRFGEPGIRWLRARVSGNEEIRPVEFISGRPHSGQDSWILSFDGVSTVEEAKQLIGSTMLVKDDARPELEDGEFYTPDLFSMKVILKETGEEVGIVVNVANYGSNDLLQVRLHGSSGSLVWVPFVEAIVPDVDVDSREMFITPPKGLLELNQRSDSRSKKERRLMAWKERKKFLTNFGLAKKKLAEMGQDHVLRGLSFGGKDKKNFLRKQISNLNLKLFEHALGSIHQLERQKKYLFLHPNPCSSKKAYCEISSSWYGSSNYELSGELQKLKSEGLCLLSGSKVAIILISDCQKNENRFSIQVKDALCAFQRFSKANEHISSPQFIVISPTEDLKLCQDLVSGSDDFGLDRNMMWILEEEKLPVVSVNNGEYKMIMRSSWEISQSSAGIGTLFSSLSSHDLLSRLNQLGMQYVQVSNLGQRCALGDPLFLGLVNSHKVNAGIKVLNEEAENTDIDMILSMEYLNKTVKDRLPQFHAVPLSARNVDFDFQPNGPEPCHLYSGIHDVLLSCSNDDVAIMKLVD